MLARLPNIAASASTTCCAFHNSTLAGDGGGVGLLCLNAAGVRLARDCAFRVAATRLWRVGVGFVGVAFTSAGRRPRRGLSITVSTVALCDAAGRLTLRTGVPCSE